jgi:hypothetical protein
VRFGVAVKSKAFIINCDRRGGTQELSPVNITFSAALFLVLGVYLGSIAGYYS